MFHRENVDQDKGFWTNLLWTDECKTELFAHLYRGDVYQKLNTEFQENKLKPDVKHRWRFAAAEPDQISVMESSMNSNMETLWKNLKAEAELWQKRLAQVISATRREAQAGRGNTSKHFPTNPHFWYVLLD